MNIFEARNSLNGPWLVRFAGFQMDRFWSMERRCGGAKHKSEEDYTIARHSAAKLDL